MTEMQTELVQISAGGIEPLTVADAKLWLRLDHDFSDHDGMIGDLITTARSHAEMYCRRSFKVGDQWQLTLNRFPLPPLFGAEYWELPFSEVFGVEADFQLHRPDAYAITIPMGPVGSIVSITYTDTSGATQTLDPSTFELLQDTDANPKVYPTYGNYWPPTQHQPDAVKVLFVAGVAPFRPAVIVMKQMVAHWYNNAEVVTAGKAATISQVVEQLRPYRLLEL